MNLGLLEVVYVWGNFVKCLCCEMEFVWGYLIIRSIKSSFECVINYLGLLMLICIEKRLEEM